MVALLYKKENITGDEVKEIIIEFEKANGLETKIIEDEESIEAELKVDASMNK